MYLDSTASFFLFLLITTVLNKVALLCLNRSLGRVIQLSPNTRAARRAPSGHLGQQRCPADAAVRVLLLKVSVHSATAGEAVCKILEEVTAEDHVYPRVAAAVETGKERRQSHCCVLRIYRTEEGERLLICKTSGVGLAAREAANVNS